jgi:hypothetical protein
MRQRAGIALSRLEYDAEFATTRVDHDPDPTYLPSTHHKLVDGHDVGDIMNIFYDTLGFDASLEDNGFVVSLPISASYPQTGAFSNANHQRLCTHFQAWATAYAKSAQDDGKNLHLLFIDLTPGQISATMQMHGRLEDGRWVTGGTRTYIRPGKSINLSSTDALYDNLVRPIAPQKSKLRLVGILRPEGAFPHISATDLESKLLGTPVKWVTLEDISYGAAILMTCEPITSWGRSESPNKTEIAIGTTLSNGNSVMILPKGEDLPTERKFMFTTSQDNQTTVTVRLHLGTIPWTEIVLEGLIPKLRGQAAIKVTLNIQRRSETTVTMEEVGTNLKTVMELGTMLHLPGTDPNKADKENTDEKLEMTLGKDGVIGELPK